MHPVGVRAGGFHLAPNIEQVSTLLKKLHAGLPEAEALVRWTASLDLPVHEQNFTSVALRHPQEYPLNEGHLVSSQGLDISIDQFETKFSEHQVPHSTALHCLLDSKPYLVGPIARLNLNLDRLPASVRALVDSLEVRFPSRNMYHGVIARAIEIVFAVQEAIRLLENYREPPAPYSSVSPRAGTGFGW